LAQNVLLTDANGITLALFSVRLFLHRCHFSCQPLRREPYWRFFFVTLPIIRIAITKLPFSFTICYSASLPFSLCHSVLAQFFHFCKAAIFLRRIERGLGESGGLAQIIRTKPSHPRLSVSDFVLNPYNICTVAHFVSAQKFFGSSFPELYLCHFSFLPLWVRTLPACNAIQPEPLPSPEALTCQCSTQDACVPRRLHFCIGAIFSELLQEGEPPETPLPIHAALPVSVRPSGC